MSGVVLDTHAVVWLMSGNPAMGLPSKELIREARRVDGVMMSAISFWELGLLRARGRIELEQPVRAWRRRVLETGVIELPVTGAVGILATELEGFPADPADRMIAATAMEAGATLVTADASILAWTGHLIRHDART